MTGEQIVGLAVMLLCCGGSGVLFFGIGVWATKQKTPMHFYAGTTIDPKRVSDIPAYNLACGKLWKGFSVPFFLAVAASVVGLWDDRGEILSLVFLILACTVGIWWLVRTYKGIEKKYLIR